MGRGIWRLCPHFPPSQKTKWPKLAIFDFFFFFFLLDFLPPQNRILPPSLCQSLDSRQLTQKTSAEGARKIERERRRRESPPEAKGERSEPFAGGARDSAKRNQVFAHLSFSLCNH